MDIKLPFASKDGKLIHISELTDKDRGLKCNCTCPCCGTSVIAKLGKKMVHHFAHSTSDCTNTLETCLHIFAKQTLEKNMKIKIPAVLCNYKQKSILIAKEQEICFDRVVLEHRIDSFIPDVILYKNDKPLIVEIAVTHFINDEKRDKIDKSKISTLEIDLSSYKMNFNNVSKAELEDDILNNTQLKKWIYNDIVAKKIIKLKEEERELRKKEKARIEREKKKQELLKAKELERLLKETRETNARITYLLNNKDNIFKEYKKKLPNIHYWRVIASKYSININKIPACLNIEIDNEMAFKTHRVFWQLVIWDIFIQNKKGAAIRVFNATNWLCKRAKYIQLNQDIINKGVVTTYGYSYIVKDVVLQYLDELTRLQILTKKTNTKREDYYVVQLDNINNFKTDSLYELKSTTKDLFEQIQIKSKREREEKEKRLREEHAANMLKIETKKVLEIDNPMNNVEVPIDEEVIVKIKINNELLKKQKKIEEQSYLQRKQQRELNKNLSEDKEGICVFCNTYTRDWSIWNGDGTCKCRACLSKQ